MNWLICVLYITAQLIGSFLAGFALRYTIPSNYYDIGSNKNNSLGYPVVKGNIRLIAAFVAEMIGSFIYVTAFYS